MINRSKDSLAPLPTVPLIMTPVLKRPLFSPKGLKTGKYSDWLAENHVALVNWYDDVVRASADENPPSWVHLFRFPEFCASQFDMELRLYHNHQIER